MPKKGRPDSYWESCMWQFAEGSLQFTTGMQPGHDKWKKVINNIKCCPRHNNKQIVDLFGRAIICKCGYHVKPPENTRKSPSASSTGPVVPDQDTISCALCQRDIAINSFEAHLAEVHASPTKQPVQQVQPVHTAPPRLKSCPTSTMPGPSHEGRHEEPIEQPVQQVKPAHKAPPLHKSCPPSTMPGPSHEEPQSMASFLPPQFRRVIHASDQEWIARILYSSNGQLRDTLENKNWHDPPSPNAFTAPEPEHFFRQRMFLWAPMRMWRIPLSCPKCKFPMSHSGIYGKVREVVDVNSRYYLIGGDYPRCNRCKVPICPWNPALLSQLDPHHRSLFPAVLTKYSALDKKCVTLMKPRTAGNSSSYIHQAIHELHSEEWAKRCLAYLSACDLHKKGAAAAISGHQTLYRDPPIFRPLPLAQWFEEAHSQDILGHSTEMKAVITSTYGRVLKLDSTKKVTKKLAGDIGETASWMTNIANEFGQVLNSVLTTGEGPALHAVCQGIVHRYLAAGEPEPEVIYVDRDCCSQSGKSVVLELFAPWKCHVRLDSFHFMRRFTKGLTTEHHSLYGTFCSKLSGCIFLWDEHDYKNLREAKTAELKMQHNGMAPTEKQVTSAITSDELARHCRRRTRHVADMKQQIQKLLEDMWHLTDTAGLPFINAEAMDRIWKVQQKHLPCLQDPQGVEMYMKTGTLVKGGKKLDVLRCARGSSSLESFHKHQCAFIPGFRANAAHTQMYLLEGSSRWNINRARENTDLEMTSQTRLYDVHLMSSLNTLSQRVLAKDLIPEFQRPGKPTDELIAVDYLLSQSGQGDLRQSILQDEDVGSFLPDINTEEAKEEVEFTPDITVPMTEDVETGAKDDYVFMTACDNCGLFLNTEDMVKHIAEHIVEEDRRRFGVTVTPESPGSINSQDTLPLSLFEGLDPNEPSAEDLDRNEPTTEDLDRNKPTTEDLDRNKPTTEDLDRNKPTTEDLDRINLSTNPRPSADVQQSRDDKGYPGWESVDALARYLVNLDLTVTALTTKDVNSIVELYKHLNQSDKSPTKYSPKSKKNVLHGPWRASRKRSGTTPGAQASERLYMVHGQAAESPKANRISECICLRLLRIYQEIRNRPNDKAGKRLPLAQSIVHTYRLIQQLVMDNQTLMDQTNICLVTINNTTVSNWIDQRHKRVDRDGLLQGTSLVPTVGTAPEPLLQAAPLPTTFKHHGHEPLTFQDPENKEGQATKRPKKRSATTNTQTVAPPQGIGQAVAPPQGIGQAVAPPQGMPGWFGWPPYHPMFFQPAPAPAPALQVPAQVSNRHRDWRHKKAEEEDRERMTQGLQPKKRHKQQYRYICTMCQQQKSAQTGHTQVKGKWYCPSMGITVEQWKAQFPTK